MTSNKPLVTILTSVYNHEPYIRDCLEGIVMQQTDFRFIAYVHDDASTDNSANIVREYEKKYPDIIMGCYEDENQYSKTGRIDYPAIESKYIAICEGDDYWTDPQKLQLQLDFLENNPEYSMCFHDVEVKVEKGRDWYDVFGKLEDRDYTGLENLLKWSVPTCSIICRAECFTQRPSNAKFRMGDNVLVLSCENHGKLRCIPRKMGVYRLSPSSWIGSTPFKEQRRKYISHYQGLIETFEQCRCPEVYALLENQYFQLLAVLKRNNDTDEFKSVANEYMMVMNKTSLKPFDRYYKKDRFRHSIKTVLGNKVINIFRRVLNYVRR